MVNAGNTKILSSRITWRDGWSTACTVVFISSAKGLSAEGRDALALMRVCFDDSMTQDGHGTEDAEDAVDAENLGNVEVMSV